MDITFTRLAKQELFHLIFTKVANELTSLIQSFVHKLNAFIFIDKIPVFFNV